MSEEWSRITEILASALERGPESRFDYVRQACGSDQKLRAEVESLLSHHDAADSLLENSPAAKFFPFPGSAWIGKQIGAYRIIRETGQGGMAVVFLAERADLEYRKQVAIKIVKPGLNHEEIIRRFRNERQTLAALDHPHIVKLLDGGTAEDGWPYLVMDYVDGLPIDRYCDDRNLPIRERLNLFGLVCRVVDYAHHRSVVHRDIKPANILITRDGVPRLLDFGIAKLLDSDGPQSGTATTVHGRPMTPEYASPEQLRGEPVTAATDIYSLGVLLYQLLTGRRPDRSSPESRPPKPSVCAASPGTNGEDLRRLLRGDLDTIVMTALSPEPRLRYPSASDFAADIDRYLSGRPVKARNPTLAYVAGKFLWRHAVSAVAVVLGITLCTGGGFWWIERHATPHESVRPSVAILGFKNLSNLPTTAWLSTALSEMLTTELAAGEKLRLVPGEIVSRAKIDLSLPDTDSLAPATLFRVHQDLGSDFVILGSYLAVGTERSDIRLDLRLQDAIKGETIASISEVGTESGLLELISRSGASLRQRIGVTEAPSVEIPRIRAAVPSNPDALRLYSQGLDKLRSSEVLGARDLLTRSVTADPAFPLAHSALAKAWQTLGYDANAARESQKAMELAGQLSREDHLLVEARYYEATANWNQAIDTYAALFRFFPDTLEYGLYLTNVLVKAGRGKDALKTLETMAQTGAARKDDPRIDLATSEAASSLGDNRLRRDAAEAAAAKAARQGAKLLVARARAQECRALANLGENEKAQAVCEEGRQIYAEAGDRAGLARILHSAAEVPLNQDDLTTAESLYRQALALTREIGDKQGIGRELVNLALIFKKRGAFETARSMNQESLQNYSDAGDKNGMAVVTGNMGNLLHMQGKLPEALRYYQDCLALSNEVGNRGSAALAVANTADTLADEGDLAGACRNYEQALTMHGELGEKSYVASTMVMWGEVLTQQGELEKARTKYMEALAIQQQLGEKGSSSKTRVWLAELACESGKPAEAESLARAAAEEFRRLKETNDLVFAEAVLARALLQQGKLSEARAAIAAVLPAVTKSKQVPIRLTCFLDHANVLAAGRDIAGAERVLKQVLAESRQSGLVRFQLQAALGLGEIQVKGKTPNDGLAGLRETESSARRMGFERIAQKAAAAQLILK